MRSSIHLEASAHLDADTPITAHVFASTNPETLGLPLTRLAIGTWATGCIVFRGSDPLVVLAAVDRMRDVVAAAIVTFSHETLEKAGVVNVDGSLHAEVDA